MKPLCLWTGKRDDRAIAVEIPGTNRWGKPEGNETAHVLPEHADELRAYAEQAQRHGASFLFWVLGLSALTLPLSVLAVMEAVPESVTLLLMGTVVVAMAVPIYVYPFATPETIAMLGVRRSIHIVHVCSWIMGMTGIGMMIGSAWI